MFSKHDQLQGYDDALLAAINAEEQRQEDHIELIASENYCSQRVMQAQGSGLTNKYAEGYPGKRYYGGCEYVDVVEQLAIDRAKELFSADYANVGMGTSISAPGGGDNSVLPSSIGEPRFVVSTGNAGVTTPGADNYLEYAGTSMAAPQVAGVLALLSSLRPNLSMADLEQVAQLLLIGRRLEPLQPLARRYPRDREARGREEE